MTLLIREATAADVLAIATFQTASWREAYAGLVPPSYLERVGVPERESRWRARICSGTREVALAERAGHVLGVVSWGETTLVDAPTLALMSLYVHPLERGTGLATDLLRRAVGTRPAHLWVFEGNRRAQAFYAKHGFRPDGRRSVDDDTGLPELLYVRGQPPRTEVDDNSEASRPAVRSFSRPPSGRAQRSGPRRRGRGW